jgi:hypothetical protein
LAGRAHFDLDGAWSANDVVHERLDLAHWGPRLRFSAPGRLIEQFFSEISSQLPTFLLYGSGDFHHLSSLWIRRVNEPFVLLSFDNHPDWDIRPPQWACGGWVNRALELPLIEKVSVWGCGNFECWWPRQLFGNRRAERQGRLEVHPWADDRTAAEQQRRGAILRTNWRDGFQDFVRKIAGKPVYITIDLDCLTRTEAITNWENGRFKIADLDWAIQQVRARCRIVGGDICGGYSEPRYARWKQRFASEMDHPKMTVPTPEEIRAVNYTTLAKVWPLLAGR